MAVVDTIVRIISVFLLSHDDAPPSFLDIGNGQFDQLPSGAIPVNYGSTNA